nr:hypothetical protein 2 [bacterium]
MPASYLHGVETIEIEKGPRPVKSVKTAVIGLVGTAPIYSVAEENRTINETCMVLSTKDAAKYFGQDKEGYSIPHALNAIFTQGAGEILVVNVFDPDKHKSKFTKVVNNKEVDFEEVNFETYKSDLSYECLTNIEIPGQKIENFEIDRLNGTISVIKNSYTEDYFEKEILNKISAIKVTEEKGETEKQKAEREEDERTGVKNFILSLFTKVDKNYVLGKNVLDIEKKKLFNYLKKMNYLGLNTNPVIRIKYEYADPSKVTSGDIIGGVNEAGKRTGFQSFIDSYGKFGFFPKILISPIFSTLSSVATAMDAIAHKIRAVAYIDAPIGTDFQDCIIGRGPEGTINFGTSSERVRLLYPGLKAYNANLDKEVVVPYSPYMAGVRARVDLEQGYWKSASNKDIRGITGTEIQLSAMINDPTCEVNLLNENGITSIFNSFGTGLRTWGNRTASWPSISHPKNFENVRRTADMIEESLEYYMLQYIDEPVNNVLIDAILSSVNAYLSTLQSRGAIVGGSCWYDPTDNPATELAAGHLTFSYDFMPPTPAERISFKACIDIKYLESLGG